MADRPGSREGSRRIFKVLFQNQGQVYEIYVRNVESSWLLGFVTAQELLFGEKSQLVLDPSEERLRTEFAGVQRVSIPIHSVIRIDEVEKPGTPRIQSSSATTGDSSNLAVFPASVLPRPKGKS